MRHAFLIVLAATLLLAGLPAVGQTSAELLQKGIYTQETVGDLDGAIRIYRQVVAAASESRALGAQAMFRLAVCLHKKGDRAAAVKTFEQLIQDYPEQKELAAQARGYLPSGPALLPAPYSDGELLEYRIKLPGGAGIGTFVYAVEPSSARPQNVVLVTRAWIGGAPYQFNRMEVERDTMRPVSNTYTSVLLGDVRLDYEPRQVRYQPKGKPASTIPLDGLYWDNEEGMWVMRRMPFSAGYKTTLPVLNPGGQPVKIELTVPAIEDVQVPAGKFRAYKVELSLVRQTIWFAVDAPRQPLKIEANGATIELCGIRRVDQVPPMYQDPKTGLSVTAPAGWIFSNREDTPPGETSAFMYDPEGTGGVVLWAKPERTEPAQIAQMLRSGVDAKARSRSLELKNYQIRPSSIETRTIGGRQALSCAADYLEGDRKMVEYHVWIRAENNRALFFARVPAAEFETFRPRLDAIVNTATIR